MVQAEINRYNNTNNLLAFKKAYDTYKLRLCAYVSKFVKNQADIEDIVQNIFLHLLETDFAADAQKLESIIFKAAKQEVYKWYATVKKFSTVQINSELMAIAEGHSSIDAMNHALMQENIINIAGRMSPLKGHILKMRLLEGRNYQEIADGLHISTSLVHRKLGQVIAALRNIATIFFYFTAFIPY